MAWVILEGVDRSGKSTVAKLYQAKGYKLVHMSAPDSKYTKPGYAGPSYMDEIMDMYMKYNAQDVVFDRSPYGEQVWPLVYGRKAQLTEDDFEILQEIENSNEVTRLLFRDDNIEAHWKRCVDNKEPLTRAQFNNANVLFERMGAKYNFESKQLTEYAGELASVGYIPGQQNQTPPVQTVTTETPTVQTGPQIAAPTLSNKSEQQLKLEKANAINELLSSRIVKKKGEAFDELERDVRDFLSNKLADIFGKGTKSTQFSDNEVQILKLLCKQTLKKMEK